MIGPHGLTCLSSALRRPESVGAWTDADWDAALALAEWHDITPLLHGYLKHQSLPATVAERLRAAYLHQVAESLRRQHQLLQVLHALQQADIPVVVLKGMALVQDSYPDPAWRTMCDIDLWVPSGQMTAAKQALAALGYAEKEIDQRPEAMQDAFGGESQLIHPSPAVMLVELHRQPILNEWQRHVLNLDQAELWQRAIPLPNTPARQLAPEDAIVHICWHIAVAHQMNPGGVRSLLDIDWLRRRHAIDWDAVVERARRWHLRKATWLVLSLLDETLGDAERPLPLDALKPTWLSRKILHRFARPQLYDTGAGLSASPWRFVYLLWLIDRPRDVLRLLTAALLPERQWIVTRYGLNGAPAWRILVQQCWHPLRALLTRNF